MPRKSIDGQKCQTPEQELDTPMEFEGAKTLSAMQQEAVTFVSNSAPN